MKKNLQSREKFLSVAISLLLYTVFICTGAYAATMEQTVKQAMTNLKVRKNDTHLLLLTDAPYVRVDGTSALTYLDKAQELTGCTVGKGNLLFFQRPQTHPLRLMLFSKADGNAVIISHVGKDLVSETLNLGPTAMAESSLQEKAKTFQSGNDISGMAAIANVWAKDAPYDFLKSAELHNHICPGLTSGYLIAHYILNRYPLADGERYTIVACPVWCKEDAFQVIMDCTPGKKGLIVKPLSDQQRETVSVANPAGMVLIWNAKQKTGKGVALSFDFDRLRALSPKDAPKSAMVLAALDHLDHPEQYVTTAAEFELNEKRYQDIIQAGSNPFEVAGLMKK